ncbi:GDP-mannose 4,6-dehydratase [bacterium]|nr:GDP-mannose 4,6-dehydratase [bacterium]MBU0900260.1 GDP-mannose 4,6-dehydratase [bacterium]MBU1152870.1 GDP-mannose 4,6-dehydratase [bacterium]MBU1782671.1 GDP-mannose 4,6-dehydratase [bacterium]
MKVLITGINGFTGEHLVRYLYKEDPEVEIYGFIERGGEFLHLEEKWVKKIRLFEVDITNYREVTGLISSILPEKIFHLAAITFGPTVKKNPRFAMEVNFFGTKNILDAALEAKINPLIHVATSSAEYGLVYEEENPVTEKNVLRPMDFYGVTKIAQDMVAYQYFKTYQLQIIRTRSFNQTGPGERKDFVCSDFAYQIALIERGKQEPVIKVGNLEAKRDFIDVRDVVKAYYLIMEKGERGEVYNVCSHKAYAIKEVLDILLKMSRCEIEVKVEKERFRPSDVPIQVGSYEKLKSQTGWKPTITFEKTLRDLLNYWRDRLK